MLKISPSSLATGETQLSRYGLIPPMSPTLIIHLARRDLTERFSGSALGGGWAFVQPLVMVFIYTVIFSQIMSARLPGSGSAWAYGVYLMSGLLPWTAFSLTCQRCCTVFSDKKTMIQQMQTNLPLLPIYIILAETFTCLVTLAILIILTLVTGDFAGWSLLALIPIYFAHQLVAYGIGLFLATLTVFLKDVKELVAIVIQLWFWVTPIVYLPEIIPEYVRPIIACNPTSIVIGCYHDIFVFHRLPDPFVVCGILALGIVLSALSICFFRRLEKDVRDFL